MSLRKKIVLAAKEAEGTATSKLTSELRRQAYFAGISHGRKLNVKLNDGNYVVTYPKSIEDQVFHSEYGDEETPPTPVIRNFMSNISFNHLDGHFGEALKKHGVI